MDLAVDKIRRVTALLIGRLGDLIVATPFLRGLQERFPQAKIRLVTSSATKEAARLIPWPDEVLCVHPYWRPWENLKFATSLLASPCDLLVDLNPSFSRTSAALALLSRAQAKAAFAKGRLDFLYTLRAHAPGLAEHMLDRYARLAALLGAPYEPRMELRLCAQDEEKADNIIQKMFSGKFPKIGIHPGNFKKFDNRWPEDKFMELTDLLLDAGADDILYLAGPGEEGQTRKIAARLKRPVPVLGPFPVGVLGALLKRLDLLVCNITGTTHLAAALGTPTFGLYTGYTNAVWRPRGSRHSGVVADSWESCRGISVSEACRELKAFLQKA